MVDYHVHSNHSCDGRSSISEMCQIAIGIGIEEIGFSEHVDFEPTDWGYGFFNYDRYTCDIESAQEIFEKSLNIRKGVEIDYQRCFEDEIKEWLRDKRFDIVIGSVHYLDHEIISRRSVADKDLGKMYDAYFEEVNSSIRSRLFGVIGHLDLLRRYIDSGRPELNGLDYWQNVKTILKEIVEKEAYLEINSNGLRDMYKDTIPSREVVNEFIKNGGKLISIGSDAHSVEEIGSGIEEILEFLRSHDGNRLKLLFE